jgi:5-methylcytosine-specific restriction endonuclease McrA
MGMFKSPKYGYNYEAYNRTPPRQVSKASEPNYFELRKTKRFCNLCGNFKVPRHLLEVDHKINVENSIDLREYGEYIHRDAPENLWVLCKYCHGKKSHWEFLGDYTTIDKLIDAVKEPEIKEALCNSSSEWIAKHQNKKLKCCERDKWVIPDNPSEPLYKEQ